MSATVLPEERRRRLGYSCDVSKKIVYHCGLMPSACASIQDSRSGADASDSEEHTGVKYMMPLLALSDYSASIE